MFFKKSLIMCHGDEPDLFLNLIGSKFFVKMIETKGFKKPKKLISRSNQRFHPLKKKKKEKLRLKPKISLEIKIQTPLVYSYLPGQQPSQTLTNKMETLTLTSFHSFGILAQYPFRTFFYSLSFSPQSERASKSAGIPPLQRTHHVFR
jgi:hypothetical protein